MSTKIGDQTGVVEAPVVLHAVGGEPIVVPDSQLLFSAEFERAGPDLVLRGDDGKSILIVDYFKSVEPADLLSFEGSVLRGDLVEVLAGPVFAGQYAQTTASAPGQPIGQVETISGGATARRADGTVVTLQTGAKVFQNDVVQTDAGANVSLTFVDGTIFTLAASSRMVLSNLIYDPGSNNNSGAFDLVEGTFVFIAGQVAKTGGMDVTTPAATMGIRGTTVLVEVETTGGITRVEVSLNEDPDGQIGQFTITGLDGSLIADVTSTATKWIISPVDGETREVPRTTAELGEDQLILSISRGAFESAQARAARGEDFVETGNGNNDNPPDPPERIDETDPEQQPGNDSNDSGNDSQRGDLGGSGLETDTADVTGSGIFDGDVIVSALDEFGFTPTGFGSSGSGDIIEGSGGPTLTIGGDEVILAGGFTNTAPVLTVPVVTNSVPEDGAILINGFGLTDPDGTALILRITAGSTVSLAPGSGVEILQGTGVDDVEVVIRGTPGQLLAALNGSAPGGGLLYMPTPNADDFGTLTLEVIDDQFNVTSVVNIDIAPVQDAPEAADDVVAGTASGSPLVGNVTANDSDVDVTPVADVLTVISASSGSTAIPIGSATAIGGGGIFTIQSDGQYTFTPGNAYTPLGEGETTTEVVNYVLSDGNGGTDNATLTVTITGSNDAPIVVGSTADIGEGGLFNGSLLVNDSDPDVSDTLSVSEASFEGAPLVFGVAFTTSRGGALTVSADGSFTFDIIGAPGYEALGEGETVTETVNYTAIDTNGATGTGVLTLVTTGSNDTPVITVTNPPPVDEGDSGTPSTTFLLSDFVTASDVDNGDVPEIDAATISISPATGSDTTDITPFTVSGLNITVDTGQYDALTTGQAGVFDVQFDVVSGGDRSTETIQITVNGANDAPVVSTADPAELDEATSPQTISLDMLVTASDVDAADTPAIDPASIAIAPAPGSATTDTGPLSVSGTDIGVETGSFDFLAAGEQAIYDVTFNVVSGPDTVSQTTQIIINGVNTSPQGFGNSLNVVEQVPFTLTSALLGVTDPDDSGAGLTYTITSPPVDARYEFSTDPGVSISSFTGQDLDDGIVQLVTLGDTPVPDTTTFQVADGGEDGVGPIFINVPINVEAANDAPTADGLPSSATVELDTVTPLDLTSLVLGDVDAGTGSLVVKFTTGNTNSVISGSSATGITLSAPGDNFSVEGTLADLQSYFATSGAIQFSGPPGVVGSETIEVTFSDNGNTGAGGNETVVAGTIDVTISDSSAAPPATSALVDVAAGTVDNLSGFQFVGEDAGGEAGRSVANIGDINNDGIADFAIGTPKGVSATGAGGFVNGEAFVVYGGQDFASLANAAGQIQLAGAGASGSGLGGFKLQSFVSSTAFADSDAGYSVAGLGDVSGDGIADFIVGEPRASGDGNNSGNSYIVYGGQNFSALTNSAGQISLGSLGIDNGGSVPNFEGFQFLTFSTNSRVGESVSSAGDINGDGINDLIVGAPRPGLFSEGSSYVVYGGQDFSSAVDMNGQIFTGQLGGDILGFRLLGEMNGDRTGTSVASVGDINNDGFDDLAVGSPTVDLTGSDPNAAGQVHIVYGGQDFESLFAGSTDPEISLSTIGTTGGLLGVRLIGELGSDAAGSSVSGAGDFNNDGISDFLITSPINDDAGAAYLVYGALSFSPTVQLSDVGSILAGVKFTGANVVDTVNAATNAGDVNGDGIADILVASELADEAAVDSGSTYVIYGGQGLSGEISLADVGFSVGGFELTGALPGDITGSSAAAAGDVNNDGFDDILVGALSDDVGGTDAGAGFLIFGGDFTGSTTQTGTSAGETLTGSTDVDVLTGAGGNDTLIGNGGADTLRGGSDSDEIRVSDTGFNLVDGGFGQDVLLFEDSGLIDLTNVANTRIAGIETLDVANGLANNLRFGIEDVFNLSDENNVEIEGFLGSNVLNSVLIDTDVLGDVVTLLSNTGFQWTENTSGSASAPDYNIYQYSEIGVGTVLATLAIDENASVAT